MDTLLLEGGLNGSVNDEDLHKCNIFDPNIPSEDPSIATDHLAPYSEVSLDGEIDEIAVLDDFPDDDCLKFISEILMEEDLDDHPAPFNDYAALEATEKSLFDAIGETGPSSSGEGASLLGENVDSPYDRYLQSCSSHESNHVTDENTVSNFFSLDSNFLSYDSCDGFGDVVKELVDSPTGFPWDSEFPDKARSDWFKEASESGPNSGCNSNHFEDNCLINQNTEENCSTEDAEVENRMMENCSKGRESLTRNDDTDEEKGCRNKHLAAYHEEYVQMELYDDVLLCKEDENGNISSDCKDEPSDDEESGISKGTKRKKGQGKMNGVGGEVVDLRTLLTQCAQAVASFDLRNTNELLKQIRLHSSPYGDSTQRMSHYLANALEARISGMGGQQCRNYASTRITSSEILKAYRMSVSAIPFRRTTYFVANDAITKLVGNAPRVHIIDFGIFFGFQWPGLIQKLSKRKVGAPMLRITGIDYPKHGFQPEKIVEETGHRLAGYCERFKVPFEYKAIAKNWDTITPEEINIESDELVIVNCLFMARKLLDESVEEKNPRDSFLRLIRKLNPDLFIHGIVNGLYGAPFFVTRFREAMFHYSSIFDMFEATVTRESNARLIMESQLYGKDALNALACEGTERVERPETYRQWQVRIQRAGFKKLPLDYKLLKKVRAAVKGQYHKDFVIDENNHWMLQGWKGRILYAISCWKSA